MRVCRYIFFFLFQSAADYGFFSKQHDFVLELEAFSFVCLTVWDSLLLLSLEDMKTGYLGMM